MREKKTVVDLLKERIVETHVKRENLCRGLCTLSALSKYLGGERRIDRLLLTALMQRLGLSPDNFATLLTEEEYRYFEWRQRLAVAQMEGNWEGVERLLEEEAAAKDFSGNQPLREQFRLMIQGKLQEKLSGDRSQSFELICAAVEKTLPGFTGKPGVFSRGAECRCLCAGEPVPDRERKTIAQHRHLPGFGGEVVPAGGLLLQRYRDGRSETDGQEMAA